MVRSIDTWDCTAFFSCAISSSASAQNSASTTLLGACAQTTQQQKGMKFPNELTLNLLQQRSTIHHCNFGYVLLLSNEYGMRQVAARKTIVGIALRADINLAPVTKAAPCGSTSARDGCALEARDGERLSNFTSCRLWVRCSRCFSPGREKREKRTERIERIEEQGECDVSKKEPDTERGKRQSEREKTRHTFWGKISLYRTSAWLICHTTTGNYKTRRTLASVGGHVNWC